MSKRTISQIDYRISRLQALTKRLRAERKVAILREQHRLIKFSGSSRRNPESKGAPL